MGCINVIPITCELQLYTALLNNSFVKSHIIYSELYNDAMSGLTLHASTAAFYGARAFVVHVHFKFSSIFNVVNQRRRHASLVFRLIITTFTSMHTLLHAYTTQQIASQE